MADKLKSLTEAENIGEVIATMGGECGAIGVKLSQCESDLRALEPIADAIDSVLALAPDADGFADWFAACQVLLLVHRSSLDRYERMGIQQHHLIDKLLELFIDSRSQQDHVDWKSIWGTLRVDLNDWVEDDPFSLSLVDSKSGHRNLIQLRHVKRIISRLCKRRDGIDFLASSLICLSELKNQNPEAFTLPPDVDTPICHLTAFSTNNRSHHTDIGEWVENAKRPEAGILHDWVTAPSGKLALARGEAAAIKVHLVQDGIHRLDTMPLPPVVEKDRLVNESG